MAQGAERVAVLESQVETLTRVLDKHLVDCATSRQRVEERFTRLERIIWMANGAIALILVLLKYLR